MEIADAPTKGAADAPIVMIEWSDFECPYCGKVARETLPDVERDFIRTGKVRMVFKHHPLERIHPHALMAAQAAVCAGRQNRFWVMHDSLYADQNHLDESSLLRRAETIGLDLASFRDCLTSDSTSVARNDARRAEQLKLASTPLFLIGRPTSDGRIKIQSVISGAQPRDVFVAALTAAESRSIWWSLAPVSVIVAVGAGMWVRRPRRLEKQRKEYPHGDAQ